MENAPERYLHYILFLAASLAFLPCLLSCGGPPQNMNDKTASYMYQDTKQLVEFVEEAASLFEKTGESSFIEFSRKDSKWFNDKWYVFIYDLNGTCIFNPVTPDINGKNMINIKDINGKPVIRMITDVGKKPGREANGWVFYHWVDRTQFDPMWKASYLRKVIDPSNRVFVLGSGLNSIKIEKVFISENVNRAATLIKEKGKVEAFKSFRDPSSSFCFFDSYITVIDSSGKTLVDPSFPEQIRRDMITFTDAVGREVIKDVMEKFKTEDEVWSQYLWPRPGESLLSRKLLYCKKISVSDETLHVCSDFYLATPIWMRL